MAIVYQFPEISPQPVPSWDADNITAIKHAKFLHRCGATAEEVFGLAPSVPGYEPIAEALARLETAEDVADVSRDMIRAASRR